MSVSLILDIIVVVLLALTILYAVRLNQRLIQLRSDKNELLQLAKTFAEATTRAETAIDRLKISSEALGSEVAKAEALKDDLAYLVNRGGRTADEMVDSVRGHGPESPASGPKPGLGGARPQEPDEETRLIEEAIRAATPGVGAKKSKKNAPEAKEHTRRITGHLATAPDRPVAFDPFKDAEMLHPSSRDLSSGLDDGDAESIGDTAAARELLKALGSVK